MTMMSDLSDDLVEEILSRVMITSLGAMRSTCKLWNNLSKARVLCKTEARQQFQGFMWKDFRFCSFRFDLHEIRNEDVKFIEASVQQIDKFNQVKISRIIHCDGLLLLVTIKDYTITRLVVWNPYLAQTRWIQPRNSYDSFHGYAFGYDNNHNHKILMITVKDFAIFDFKLNSWRVLNDVDVIYHRYMIDYKQSVSLKGNTYFLAERDKIGQGPEIEVCLFCFDFSIERFVPILPLPFSFYRYDKMGLSLTREDKIAVLYKPWDTSKTKIWVTTKIEPNVVLWSNYLTIDMTPLDLKAFDGSFFIDQEKKISVLFDVSKNNGRNCKTACIIGESGYMRKVDLGETHYLFYPPIVFSYAPSLVQISHGLDQDH